MKRAETLARSTFLAAMQITLADLQAELAEARAAGDELWEGAVLWSLAAVRAERRAQRSAARSAAGLKGGVK